MVRRVRRRVRVRRGWVWSGCWCERERGGRVAGSAWLGAGSGVADGAADRGSGGGHPGSGRRRSGSRGRSLRLRPRARSPRRRAPGSAGGAVTPGSAGGVVAPAPAGGAVAPAPAGSVAPGSGAAPGAGGGLPLPGVGVAGAPSAAVVALLANPRLQMPAGAQALLSSGQADPRLVSVLQSSLAHHTITLGSAQQITDPVHAQAIDIVAVDGQAISPTNFAARDLITEIAALDPSTRPNEITTPWPIEAQGFFTDPQHPAQLHLAFTSPTDYQPTPTPNATPRPPPRARRARPRARGFRSADRPPTPPPLKAPPKPPPKPSPPHPPHPPPPASSPPTHPPPPPALPSPPNPPPEGAAAASAAAAVTPAGIPGDPFYASAKAHAVFETAKSQLGVPYQWGGTSPRTGFDCSGLMQWAFKQQGIDIPRVAADQFHVGTPVDLAHLREGDLVFFQDSTGYIHHVGMYVGNHKFLEAPHTGDVVRYDDLNSPYWAQQFAGGRRIVPLDAPSAAPASSGVSGGGAIPAGAPSAAPTAGAAGAGAAAISAMPGAGAALGRGRELGGASGGCRLGAGTGNRRVQRPAAPGAFVSPTHSDVSGRHQTRAGRSTGAGAGDRRAWWGSRAGCGRHPIRRRGPRDGRPSGRRLG